MNLALFMLYCEFSWFCHKFSLVLKKHQNICFFHPSWRSWKLPALQSSFELAYAFSKIVMAVDHCPLSATVASTSCLGQFWAQPVHLRLVKVDSWTYWPVLSRSQPASHKGQHCIATVAVMSNAAATEDLQHLMRVIASTRTKTEWQHRLRGKSLG